MNFPVNDNLNVNLADNPFVTSFGLPESQTNEAPSGDGVFTVSATVEEDQRWHVEAALTSDEFEVNASSALIGWVVTKDDDELVRWVGELAEWLNVNVDIDEMPNAMTFGRA